MAIALTIADLTTGDKDLGAGSFDVLMRAVKEHMVEEHTAGRIRGTEYASVYLGTMQSTLDRSLQFLLSRDKLNIELEILELEKDKQLLEKDKLTLEVDLAALQKDLVIQQTCKLKAEFDVLEQQVLKVGSETALLNQKKVTEQAQTTGGAVDVDSVIGKQKALYGAQADGFARDAEQKLVKMLADTWNVRRTTDEGTLPSTTNKLDDATIGSAVTKALEGIGIGGV